MWKIVLHKLGYIKYYVYLYIIINIHLNQTAMRKVAKLVAYSFMTRVVVDEDATDDQIIQASKRMIIEKVNLELGEHLESIEDDEECPIGTFETDLPTIDKVILNPIEKQYVVIGKGIPVQVRRFDNYSDWDDVNDLNGEPVFDVQIDFDDSVKMDNENNYYQFQYVNIIYDEDGNAKTGLDYYNADELIITETPLAQVIADLFKNNYK
jgi:hypothetical protein